MHLEHAVHYRDDDGVICVRGPFYVEKDARKWIEENLAPAQFIRVSVSVNGGPVLGSIKAAKPSNQPRDQGLELGSARLQPEEREKRVAIKVVRI